MKIKNTLINRSSQKKRKVALISNTYISITLSSGDDVEDEVFPNLCGKIDISPKVDWYKLVIHSVGQVLKINGNEFQVTFYRHSNKKRNYFVQPHSRRHYKYYFRKRLE